jgi:plastocyanin
MRQQVARWGIGGMAVVILIGGGATPARADDATVTLQSNAFSPREVTITAGETVTWVHEDDGVPHSVSADGGSFDSHPTCPPVCMTAGHTFARTFGTPGTFAYYCRVHGGPGGQGMAGVVTVVPPVQQDTTTTAAPPTSASNSAADSTDDTEAAPEPLPRTGLDITVPIGAAFVLVAAGAVATAGARRRRRSPVT